MKFKCADTDVADLSTGTILNRDLLPVWSWEYNDIIAYMERRIYSGHNKIARVIAQRREEQTAFKLGLSDSYWVSFDEDVKFKDVSPYYQEFGTLEFVRGLTEPTLRLMGTFDKEWVRAFGGTFICKREPVSVARVEVLASMLAAQLNVGDSIAAIYSGESGGDGIVYTRNLSSPERMLLDFGSILPEKSLSDGLVFKNVQSMYDIVGLHNIGDYILRVNLFDGVIGNHDRRENQGNWGFYKSTKDGSVSVSHAYDFNMAYSLDVDDALLDKRVAGIKQAHKKSAAKVLLEQWHEKVQVFAQKYDYYVWHDNLRRMYAKLG